MKMVGVILLKNTTDGSYRYVRITAYDGKYYSDMDIDKPYSTYTVDAVQKCVSDRFLSCDESPKLRLGEVNYIFEQSRQYFLKYPYATQLLFKYDGNSVEFKINSMSAGVCEIPDFVNLFLQTGTYFLCGGLQDKIRYTTLNASILCDAVNFAVNKCFGISNRLFYYSCGYIYVDVGIMFNRFYSRIALKRCVRKYKGAYSTLKKLYFNETCSKTDGNMGMFCFDKKYEQFQHCPSLETFADLIETYREVMTFSYDILKKHMRHRILTLFSVNCIFELCFNQTLIAKTEKCGNRFLSYGEQLKEWGYYPKDFNFEYISADEFMLGVVDAQTRERLGKLTKERSKNYRMSEKFPTPKFIDCFGKCFFDNFRRNDGDILAK